VPPPPPTESSTAALIDAHAYPGVPALTPREHRRLAELLHRAASEQRPPPSLGLYPELTAADALGIGRAFVGRRLAEGERLVGAKAVRVAPGPGSAVDVSWLTDAMLRDEPARVSLRGGGMSVRPALAFLLARALDGDPPVGPGALVGAATVAPCVEVMRHRGFGDLTTAARVAADASTDLVVLGAPRPLGAAELQSLVVRGVAGNATPAGARALEAGVALAGALLRGGAALPAGFLLVAPCGPVRSLTVGTRATDFGVLGVVRLADPGPPGAG
jgi:2-keto-4-pentenoate hydratase